MPVRRPPAFDSPAFCLGALECQGSLEAQPVCAAKCEPMSRIHDHLYIGSWRDLEEPDKLRAAGITHVMNVAKEVDPAHHAGLEGFCCLHIPLVDEHRENIVHHVEAACQFIEGAKAENGRVLVHCRRGISRSPAIVVGYLMRQDGFEYDAAVELVKSCRLCTSLNIAFREFLMAYETPHVKAAQRAQSHTFDEDETMNPTPGNSDGGQSVSGVPPAATLPEPEASSP